MWPGALCLGFAVAAALPAHAQADERKSSVKEAERVMQEYAECIVRRSSSKARLDEYLQLSPNTPNYYELGRKLATDQCVRSGFGTVTMRFQPVMFRFSLYEARYRRQFGKGAPPDIVDQRPLDLVSEFDVPAAQLPPEVVFMRTLGNCVVRLDPAQSHALVLSALHSDAEKAVVAALQPALGSCVPEGSTLRFSRTMLRGALAEALYKLQPQPQLTKVAK